VTRPPADAGIARFEIRLGRKRLARPSCWLACLTSG
jgi:hypothetical protein